MSFLTGKAAKSTSSSSNVNNGLLTSTYGGQMTDGTTATNFLTSLLTGTGNTAAANTGYQNYLQQAGYAPAMKQLSQNITGQGAASGLLQSGSTDKALETQGANLNNQFYNNYLQQLSGLSGLGLQAGGLVANAGQESQSTSTGASPGLLGSLGSLAGGVAGVMATPVGGPVGTTIASKIFSDRRLKRDIERVGEFADGLGIYSYRYVMGIRRVLGVMADEVARIRPWALGPVHAGFHTVDYGAL